MEARIARKTLAPRHGGTFSGSRTQAARSLRRAAATRSGAADGPRRWGHPLAVALDPVRPGRSCSRAPRAAGRASARGGAARRSPPPGTSPCPPACPTGRPACPRNASAPWCKRHRRAPLHELVERAIARQTETTRTVSQPPRLQRRPAEQHLAGDQRRDEALEEVAHPVVVVAGEPEHPLRPEPQRDLGVGVVARRGRARRRAPR